MKAWHLQSSPSDYVLGEVDLEPPGPEDVRVEVKASALNHMDLWLTRGLPKPKSFPHVSGCDVAGVVTEIGSEVSTVAIGDEVIVNPTITSVEAILELGIDAPVAKGMQMVGENRWGGHSQYIGVPARNVVAKPGNRSFAECAAFPVAYGTAYRMLRRARLQAGETVLIVGIGGGVSHGLMAIALAQGANVIVTSRDEAKLEAALAAGASQAINSDLDVWDVQAEVVAESVGAATWDKSIRALRPAGRMAVCGATSGAKVNLDLARLWFKQIEIIGSTMSSYEEFEALTAMVADGLTINLDSVVDFDAYPMALERLRSGEQDGKIVLGERGA